MVMKQNILFRWLCRLLGHNWKNDNYRVGITSRTCKRCFKQQHWDYISKWINY